MPSALAASRQYLARQLAQLRASSFDKSYGEPDIKVEPFDARNVSTPAALIKLGTSIEAARRKKANTARALEELDAEREKSAAQIALLRAQEKYYLGEGRQTGSTPRTLSAAVGKYPAGTDLGTVTAGQAQERIEQNKANAERRLRYRNRVANAKFGISQLDAEIKRLSEFRANQSVLNIVDPVISRVAQAGANANPHDLKLLDIDPNAWALPPTQGGALTDAQRAKILNDVRQLRLQQWTNYHMQDVGGAYDAKRKEYQAIADEQPPDDQDLTDEGNPQGLDIENDNPAGLDINSLDLGQ